MRKYLFPILLICFSSCASTDQDIDAIRQQENQIKNHPTWKHHDFGFKHRKPELNQDEIVKNIIEGDKIKSVSDTITIFQIRNLTID